MLIFGYSLFVITALGFAFFTSTFALVILFAMYGTVFAFIDGNQRAYVSDLSPKELKATSLGTFHATMGLMALPASLIAGFLWQAIMPSVAFIYASIVSFIAVLLFLMYKE